MEDFTKKKGQRIFVHCHAGQGRTGIVCASYLFYAGIAPNADAAIQLFKQQRLSTGALKRKRDQDCVREFCTFLQSKRMMMYPAFKKISDVEPPKVTHANYLGRMHSAKSAIIEELRDQSPPGKRQPKLSVSGIDTSV
jgi:hypothetical protein